MKIEEKNPAREYTVGANASITIKDVGDYGIVLSSNYNLRPRPIELIIDNLKVKKISAKQSLNDII